MNNISLRIKELVDKFGDGKNSKLAAILGTSEANIRNYISGRQPKYDFLFSLISKLEINYEWLFTGEGDMLKDPTSQNQSAELDAEYIPLLPISAQAGKLTDFIVSVKDKDFEQVISPIKGADFAMTVSGDSMSPEFPNGSQILIKRINEKAFMEWGKVYVLDTCNGTVIKIITQSEKEGYLHCTSINPDQKRYEPFDVPGNEIYGIYRVLLCMSIK